MTGSPWSVGLRPEPRSARPGEVALTVALVIVALSVADESPDGIWVLLSAIVAAYSLGAHEATLARSLTMLGVLGASVAVSILLDPSDDATNIAPTLLIFI